MGMLFFVFVCIFILAGVSLYISYSLGPKAQFDRVVQFLLVYMIIHVVHAFFVRLLPGEYIYIDKSAPFGLLYGPFVYYAYLTSREHVLNRKTVLIHAFPFMIVIPFYILFLASSSFREHSMLYYSILYGPMALSWLGYAMYVAYKGTVNKGISKEADSFKNRELPSVVVIILFALSFFMILVVSTLTFKGVLAESISGELILFVGMLAVIFHVFLFTVQGLKMKIDSLESQLYSKQNGEEEVVPVYVKSGLQNNEIDEYAQRVNDYLQSKKYIDPRFNLSTISSDLKIPKHHLSQVFSQYYGRSFLKHINALRIMHACDILEDPDFDSNIDDLAERCGFNSKTSFYRNFREVAKMTPSEFLNRSEVYE